MEEISGEDKRVKERDMGELPATARKVTSTGLRCKNAKAACRKKAILGPGRKQETIASVRGRTRKGRHSGMKPSR